MMPRSLLALGTACLLLLLPRGTALHAEIPVSPDTAPRIRPLPNAARPGLLFVEGPVDYESLFLATFQAGQMSRFELLSARYLEVTQVSGAIFLLVAKDGSRTGNSWLADFDTGRVVYLGPSPYYYHLRSNPKNQSAVIARTAAGLPFLDLLLVDYASLAIRTISTLSTETLSAEQRAAITPWGKLSSDFRRYAYLVEGSSALRKGTGRFELRVLDLTTMTSSVVEADVACELADICSVSAKPPFAWVDDTTLIYQHIPPSSRRGATTEHIFRVARFPEGRTEDRLVLNQRLSCNCGTLSVDPVFDQLIYAKGERQVLDHSTSVLRPLNRHYSVTGRWNLDLTTVSRGDLILYSGSHGLIGDLVSPSGRHFAYALRPEVLDLRVSLYASLAGLPRPIQVGNGPYWPTRAVAWVERSQSPPSDHPRSDDSSAGPHAP